jgi:hypothetical protein
MKMNKGKLSAFIAASMFCAAFTMTSCSSSDGLDGKTTSISIPVNGESFGDDVSSRTAAKVDTVRQSLGNGVVLEATIAPDGAVQTRSANTVTDGTQVLVAVYKGSTYYRSLTASISSGKISNLELPINTSLNLRFYAHADKSSLPTATSDGKITDTNTDLMYGHIDGVTLDSNGNVTAGNLSSGFTFKHLYTRARVTMTTTAGKITALSGLNLTGSPIKYSSVKVNLYDGTLSNYSSNANSQSFTIPTTLDAASITTGYSNFIVNPSVTPALGFSSVTASNVAYTNKSMNLNSALTNGHSYTIGMNLKIPTYNIVYNASSGDTGVSNLPASTSKPIGTDVNLTTATPTRAETTYYGYSFIGWSKTNGGTTVDFATNASVSDAALGHTSGNVNLYAVWKQTTKCSLLPTTFAIASAINFHVIVGASYEFKCKSGWNFTINISDANNFTETANNLPGLHVSTCISISNGVLSVNQLQSPQCMSMSTWMCTDSEYGDAMQKGCYVMCTGNANSATVTASDCP